MEDITEIEYHDALARTVGRRRHLLLGNGFSISARTQFRYDALRSAADQFEYAKGIFDGHEGANFEELMASLLRGLEAAYREDEDETTQLIEERLDGLRRLLADTVTLVHPASSFSMRREELQNCANFLAPYIGRATVPHGIVFTVNYDLLLYWTVVTFGARQPGRQLEFHDAFQGDVWLAERMRNADLSIVFLHGGIHIFDDGGRIVRVRYQHGPAPRNLITQIRERLSAEDLPVFVAEGSAERKLQHIQANPYLREAFRKFRFACKDARDSLFTVGHSLSLQDSHLTDLIGRGTIGRVFVGAYGGRDSADGRRAVEVARQWHQMRGAAPKFAALEVFVFDSRACGIWESAGQSA